MSSHTSALNVAQMLPKNPAFCRGLDGDGIACKSVTLNAIKWN